ncbi:MAG: class I SAM-dependent methyltransferase [Chloroflexi bacterium]|nr:class I SAM-dependent methyltransferase [Chloroflexota bacterium]MYD17427.1 class I SAM-dependent methyltransferase [Chloroflexota bacterium]
MQAADRYNAMVRARQDQQRRLSRPFDESYWERYAHTYRFDPTRSPEASLRELIRRLEMDDEIVEIGGGAGRMGLPLALRARSLRNIEPSAAMREQFRLSVGEHGIGNAEAISSAWPMREPISADVVLTVDVTYFIDDIEPFVRAMHETARRRVMILTWTVPPPNVSSRLFRIAFDEEEHPSPGFKELLPVVWDMGIAPDVLVINEPFSWPEQLPRDDDAAVQFAIEEIAAHDHSAAADNIRVHIDELFKRGEVYRPAWRTPAKAMLITWSTE